MGNSSVKSAISVSNAGSMLLQNHLHGNGKSRLRVRALSLCQWRGAAAITGENKIGSLKDWKDWKDVKDVKDVKGLKGA
jgi:hypothetical protein